ncbi:MAG: hypothetical protein SGARI_004736, partial [Bacillariaceae sp.]
QLLTNASNAFSSILIYLSSGCTDECPICTNIDLTEPARGGEGEECRVCRNDAMLPVDPGCTESLPVCVNDEADPFGDFCAICINNQSGTGVDDGCTPEAPLCNGAADGGAGTACFTCQDTDDSGLGQVDLGCQAGAGVCVTPLGLGLGDASGLFGNECALCVNSSPGSDADIGCESDPDNGFDVCAACFG